MDRIRHVLAVLAVVVYGPGLLFWLLVHPFARWWRRLGPATSYVILGVVLAGLGAGLFRVSRVLLGRDLGTDWRLIGGGGLLLGILGWLELAYGRHMNHLTVATRMGVPELAANERRQTLVRDGVYGVVRHPIYLSAALAGMGCALIINYLGTYILFVAALPVFYAIIVLEERELVERFGEGYRQYQHEVPQLVPRWRKTA